MAGEDPRFCAANHPAFGMRRGGRKGERNGTITNDERFLAVETDERFSVRGGAPKVDKYGRNISFQSGGVQKMKKKKENMVKKRSGEINPTLQPQLAVATSRREIEKRMDILNKLARGETSGNISSDESSSSSSSGYSEEEDSDGDAESSTTLDHRAPRSNGLLDEESIPEGDAHRRIAVLNCDWEHMHSKDLLALVSSFCPKGETLLSVTVYESDYGKHQMELESKHGPGRALREIERQLNKVSNAGHSRDGRIVNRERKGIVLEKDKVELSAGGAGSCMPELEIIRAYELQKLRYYFAIVECSSVNCAEAIYSQLDGMEFETSSVALDLRFVPDETTFNGKAVRDASTSIPSNYSPPAFVLKAVQQSNVDCSWDEPPMEREVLLKGSRRQGWDDVHEEELEKFLQGSDDDDSSDDENLAMRVEKARRSLLSDNIADIDFPGGNTREEDGGVDTSNYLLSDGEEDEDEVMPEDNRKEEAAASMKKKISKNYSLDSKSARCHQSEPLKTALNDRTLEDKKWRRRGGKVKCGVKSEHIFSEPLLPQQRRVVDSVNSTTGCNDTGVVNDEDDDIFDFDMRALEHEDKLKGKKLRGKRKRKELRREKAVGREFEVDVKDPRFAAVLEGTDERFGIDKTAPEFRDTEGMNRILEMRLKRHQEREERLSNAE